MSPVSSTEMPIVKNGATKAQAIPATDSAIPTNDLWLLRGSLIPLHSSLPTPTNCNYSHYTSAEQTCAKGSGLPLFTEFPTETVRKVSGVKFQLIDLLAHDGEKVL